MVLADLGNSITSALRKISSKTIIDKEAIAEMLKEIGNALVAADVNMQLVLKIRRSLMDKLDLEKMSAATNRSKAIERAVFDELVSLLDPGVKPYKPVKRKSNVIMFVGLQGAGKTTTVTKLANYYKKKKWSVGMVCCDTFRAGAFDQLKQNATRAGIEYYGSYTERDPVIVAEKGVNTFREDQTEIIIVDTSGRHKQEIALFEEMQAVHDAINPDLVVFVMDSTIGQAAKDQAEAFKKSIAVGACIITKLDGNAKGGGAISAVAATEAPIIFYGEGEKIDDFKVFEPESFVQKLLGMGDMKGLAELMKDVVGDNMEEQEAMAARLSQGLFSLRDMYEQFGMVMKMGPLTNVMEMMPGMANVVGAMKKQGADPGEKLKQFLIIMDSMSNEELDQPQVWRERRTKEQRIRRVAMGSGCLVADVELLLKQYGQMAKQIAKLKGVKGLHKMGQKGNNKMNARNLQKVSSMLPPGVLSQMGGLNGLQKMMSGMQGQ